MRNLQLDKLILDNFKGMRDLELDLEGKSAQLVGANETGKTTIFDAFSWLLFDQDSKGNSNFKIKTMKDGEAIHHLDHSVLGYFYIEGAEDGRMKLKKTYKEKYRKKRGQDGEKFTGHTNDYYIDGVPVKKGEYDDMLDDMIGQEILQILSNPRFFSEELHWKDRRMILKEVVEDPSRDEVSAQVDEDLTGFLNAFGSSEVEDFRKVQKNRIKELNEELDIIPERIDEAEDGIPDLELSREEIKERLSGLREKKEELKEDLEEVRADSGASKIRKKIRELETEMDEIERNYRGKIKDRIADAKDDKRKLKSRYEEAAGKRTNKKNKLSKLKQKSDEIEEKISVAEKKITREKGKEFEEGEKVCPTCGQELPKDEIEEKRKKFNRRKVERIDEYQEKLDKFEDKKVEVNEKISRLKQDIPELKDEANKLEDELESKSEEISELKLRLEGFKDLEEYQSKAEKKENLEAKLVKEESPTAMEKDIKIKLDKVEENIKKGERRLGKWDTKESQLQKVENLKKEQKELSKELDKRQKLLHQAELFDRARYQLLEDKVNEKFDMATFQLFEEQVNGGIKEVCEAEYGGVPYSAINSAAKIQVGIDIINTLQDYYEFIAPIFIDNRESVTEIPETRAQVISLVVEEGVEPIELRSGSRGKVLV